MRFVDEAAIIVRSGKGGAGCVSFRREKFIPKGGPDGGDGGKGGDVMLRAYPDLLTLYDLRLKRIYEARNGSGGMGRQKNGKAAEDLVIDVPLGTQLYEVPPETSLYEAPVEPDQEDAPEALAVPVEAEPEKPVLVADLTEPGQTYVACRGGRGGKGNLHFTSSTMRAPRFAQPGEPGEEKRLKLMLKVLADVGIIGLPNAGKSTFIAAVSRAQPKIAAYPFTTLTPNLGVVEGDMGDRLVMADIPGLIEGAHEGLGLGHRFLRHVERTRCCCSHLVSAEDTAPETLFEAFGVVDEELRLFDPGLAARPQIRVVNKIDLLSPEDLAVRRQAAEASGLPVLFMSALTGEGVEVVLEAIWKAARPAEPAEPVNPDADAR
jgi:GTP-binding protein